MVSSFLNFFIFLWKIFEWTEVVIFSLILCSWIDCKIKKYTYVLTLLCQSLAGMDVIHLTS
jgi:hypothetical protein